MSTDISAAKQIKDENDNSLTVEQVVGYLRAHPNFFIEQDDLLADLSLPHESGQAISLLERQVTILRDRGIEARQKLNNLLENARDNDQLFDTTCNLVLALLRADSITEIAEVTQDQLSNQASIDACEIIIIEHPKLNVPNSIRTAAHSKLQLDFNDVFRLKRTHCGALSSDQISYLFPTERGKIRSTAICPAICNSEILALLVFGNQSEEHFNINLDTLFLDFIGRVVGAILDKELNAISN